MNNKYINKKNIIVFIVLSSFIGILIWYMVTNNPITSDLNTPVNITQEASSELISYREKIVELETSVKQFFSNSTENKEKEFLSLTKKYNDLVQIGERFNALNSGGTQIKLPTFEDFKTKSEHELLVLN